MKSPLNLVTNRSYISNKGLKSIVATKASKQEYND